ncbi:efflux RND transporter periplasmic adaptor subunit [Leeuwenhoekiella sp. A16]|uniref:efflux RND transporter periplasmic adaptor subunit n=1 Tax=unclassified Leeuwenhoekiella TaxID=2615029 RepID=UPI003A7F8FC8
MRTYTYTFLLLFALTFLSCGNSSEKDETTTEPTTSQSSKKGDITVTKPQFDQSYMQLGKMSEHTFPDIVEATGMIDVPPQNRAVISAFSGGYIKNTPLLIGDKVKKGQPLVTLENPDFIQMQQDYLENKEQLTYLKSEYDRQQTMLDENITSQKKFLSSESDYKRALAMTNGLRRKLQLLNINVNRVEAGDITSVVTVFSPISGTISEVMVSTGAYVSPADEIMQIIDTDHIHLELSVFEKDIMPVKEEQPLEFQIPESSPQSYKGEVHLVGKSINEKTRTIKVHGHPVKDESTPEFSVGMFVEAQIITGEVEQMALPNEAVVSVDDTSYVLVLNSQDVNGYHFDQKEVKTGASYNGLTVIENFADFDKDSQFLIKGAFTLITE